MRTENEIWQKVKEYDEKSLDAFDKYMDAVKTGNISWAEYCYSLHKKFSDFSLQLRWALGQVE